LDSWGMCRNGPLESLWNHEGRNSFAKWRPTCRNCSTVPSPLHRLHVLSKSR